MDVVSSGPVTLDGGGILRERRCTSGPGLLRVNLFRIPAFWPVANDVDDCDFDLDAAPNS